MIYFWVIYVSAIYLWSICLSLIYLSVICVFVYLFIYPCIRSSIRSCTRSSIYPCANFGVFWVPSHIRHFCFLVLFLLLFLPTDIGVDNHCDCHVDGSIMPEGVFGMLLSHATCRRTWKVFSFINIFFWVSLFFLPHCGISWSLCLLLFHTKDFWPVINAKSGSQIGFIDTVFHWSSGAVVGHFPAWVTRVFTVPPENLPSDAACGMNLPNHSAETYSLASVSGAHFNPAVTLAVKSSVWVQDGKHDQHLGVWFSLVHLQTRHKPWERLCSCRALPDCRWCWAVETRTFGQR